MFLSHVMQQKRRKGNKIWFVHIQALLVPLLLLAGCSLAHPILYLEVAECDSGEVLFRHEVEQGDKFSIWFFHSYDRAPFEEFYRIIDENKILLTHMVFKASLNGQGFALGTYQARKDGFAQLSEIEQEMNQVVFRLGSPDLANHTLILNGCRIRLLDYAGAGTLLCIMTKTRGCFDPLYGDPKEHRIIEKN